MKIDTAEARRIADLAHLEFDEAGLERMAGEMTAILTYIDQLRDADVGATAVTVADGAASPLREDVPGACVDREGVAANAPAWSDGFFVVPRVIGGE
jgi:aspartyl-tRNA(Asn)/glutamyl-tRNA(Gln) amidotransferase subunit C